jgi:hypothetical protein
MSIVLFHRTFLIPSGNFTPFGEIDTHLFATNNHWHAMNNHWHAMNTHWRAMNTHYRAEKIIRLIICNFIYSRIYLSVSKNFIIPYEDFATNKYPWIILKTFYKPK